MPVLRTDETIKRIYLPSTADLAPDDPEKAWVDVAVGPVLGRDVEKVTSQYLMSAAHVLLQQRIRDWNYTDDAGVKAEISLQNIGIMRNEDILHIVSEIEDSAKTISKDAELSTEEKKTSSSTSVAPATGVSQT